MEAYMSGNDELLEAVDPCAEVLRNGRKPEHKTTIEFYERVFGGKHYSLNPSL